MLEEAQVYKDMGVNTVIWVEAQPKDDYRNQRANQFGQMLYEGVALSDVNGTAMLKVVNNAVSSSILPLKRHAEIYPDIVVVNQVETPTKRAEDLFGDKFPPEIDTLVLDVQGAELMVLKGMGRLLDQIKRIWAETNVTELYQGCVLQPELDSWLAKAGFVNREYYEVHHPEWGETFYYR